MGKRTKDGKFTSEYLKGNKFALGNKPNKTSFKKGENFMENHPSWKGGIQNNKKNGPVKNLGNGKRTSMARYVWEQTYHEIPKGYVVYRKDGNVKNYNIENLEVITRGELMLRNNKKNQ
jgi:hypothetical protein